MQALVSSGRTSSIFLALFLPSKLEAQAGINYSSNLDLVHPSWLADGKRSSSYMAKSTKDGAVLTASPIEGGRFRLGERAWFIRIQA